GGYYCQWHFKPTLVSRYLQAVAKSGIERIEIGFRSSKHDKFYGPYHYCSEEILATLAIPSTLEVVAMSNAKEFFDNGECRLDIIDRLYSPRQESRLDGVRLACHFAEIAQITPVAERLKEKGYEVAVNLMQVGNQPDEAVAETARLMQSCGLIDILYFADSLGNLEPKDVNRIITLFKGEWSGSIGIHTHNNMGNGLANSLQAIESGVEWLDSTMLGMGRGAGNACTEYLLLELVRKYSIEYHPKELFDLVLEEFVPLQREYGWGPNLLYYMAALYKIHPTYIQEILSYENLKQSELIQAVERLRDAESLNFSRATLQDAIEPKVDTTGGDWNPSTLVQNKDVLLVAAGKSVSQHREAIEAYIRREKPIVISLNVRTELDPKYITAYAACHPLRIFSDYKEYCSLTKPLIAPKAAFSNQNSALPQNLALFNYGVEFRDNSFEPKSQNCILPAPLAAGYAFALCFAGGANRILMAGFDGYRNDLEKQKQMSDLLHACHSYSENCEMIAITPTIYELTQSSVYFPQL
ncbi:MAG: hypothetical protein KDD53_00550, partial [Bdellovibrionales bacterium]|nr:hypothetical protein [Bdellovibrionales bacterium]